MSTESQHLIWVFHVQSWFFVKMLTLIIVFEMVLMVSVVSFLIMWTYLVLNSAPIAKERHEHDTRLGSDFLWWIVMIYNTLALIHVIVHLKYTNALGRQVDPSPQAQRRRRRMQARSAQATLRRRQRQRPAANDDGDGGAAAGAAVSYTTSELPVLCISLDLHTIVLLRQA